MRLLTVEETAKEIGFVAFGPGTELGTLAIQKTAEKAAAVVPREIRPCHEREDIMGGSEPGTTRVELKLSLSGVMDRLLHLLGESVTVCLGFLPAEQGTLAVVNVGTPDGHDYILAALGIGHLPILRVLLNCLDGDELGEGIERGERP